MNNTHLTETRFSNLELSDRILCGLKDAGFKQCTPIQDKALPLSLRGKDIAGQAQTGTGKTAAFLLATFQYLLNDEWQEIPEDPDEEDAIVGWDQLAQMADGEQSVAPLKQADISVASDTPKASTPAPLLSHLPANWPSRYIRTRYCWANIWILSSRWFTAALITKNNWKK